MFPRKCVDYETCSCACSRIKRRLCELCDLRRHVYA